MKSHCGIAHLKNLGGGRRTPEAIAALHREAFERYGMHALRSHRPSAEPTKTQALVVAEPLRREGNIAARGLAAKIENACCAAL